MSHFGDFEHHLQISVEDYIPNICFFSIGTFTNPRFRAYSHIFLNSNGCFFIHGEALWIDEWVYNYNKWQ